MHDISPFNAVWANMAHSVNLVGNVMGHFVWHGCGQIIIKEFGENIRVVAYQPVFFADLVHPRRASYKIESDWNKIEIPFINLAGLCNVTSGSFDDTLLLGIVYGGYLTHNNAKGGSITRLV